MWCLGFVTSRVCSIFVFFRFHQMVVLRVGFRIQNVVFRVRDKSSV